MKWIFAVVLVPMFAFSKTETISERIYVVAKRSSNAVKSELVMPATETVADFSLVKMNPDLVSQLSVKLHKELNICGGFLDVTDEFLKSGKSPKMFLKEHRIASDVSFDKAEPTFPEAVKDALKKFDQERYWNFLKQLSSFPDRSATTANGEKAAKWLGDNAMKLATDLKRDDVSVRYFETSGYKQPSTVIKIKGKNSDLPAVVVGGHMDTLANGKPGADDDGSGTSTVMEVFTATVTSGLKFDRDIYFAFYAAEERGLVGSGVVAQTMLDEGTKIRGAVQFDMTGYRSTKDTKKIYFIDDNVDVSMTSFLKKLATTYLNISAEEMADDSCGYACSDHAQWYRRDVPSAFPFESSFENYNKAIHTSEDKIDSLNSDHSSQFARLGIAFVVEAAEPVQ